MYVFFCTIRTRLCCYVRINNIWVEKAKLWLSSLGLTWQQSQSELTITFNAHTWRDEVLGRMMHTGRVVGAYEHMVSRLSCARTLCVTCHAVILKWQIIAITRKNCNICIVAFWLSLILTDVFYIENDFFLSVEKVPTVIHLLEAISAKKSQILCYLLCCICLC